MRSLLNLYKIVVHYTHSYIPTIFTFLQYSHLPCTLVNLAIMPANRAHHPANQPVANMLEEEREATNNENRKATLRRAIRSILALDYPITSKAEALQVRCVGSVIATKIDVFLRTVQGPAAAAVAAAVARQARAQRTPESVNLPTPSPSFSATQVLPTNASLRVLAQETGSAIVMTENDEEHNTSGVGRSSCGLGCNDARGAPRRDRGGFGTALASEARKPYVPKYRSGSFACLMVLLDAYEEGVYRLSLHELQERGHQYCDEIFVRQKTSDPRTHYDGWSGMVKLTREGLVARSGNPARFELTMSGLEIAKECRVMDNDAFVRTVQEHGQITGEVGREGGCRQSKRGVSKPSSSYQNRAISACGSSGRENRPVQAEEEPLGPSREFALVYPEEFGCLRDEPSGRKKVSRQTSSRQVSCGRVNQCHVNRAIRVCERLEADGYKRDDCISFIRNIYDRGNFPSSDDRLYELMSTRLWEQRIRRQQRESSKCHGRKISLRDGTFPEESTVLTTGPSGTSSNATLHPTENPPVLSPNPRRRSSALQTSISLGSALELAAPVLADEQYFKSYAERNRQGDTRARIGAFPSNVSRITPKAIPVFNEGSSTVSPIHSVATHNSVAEVVISDDEDSVTEVDIVAGASTGRPDQKCRKRPRLQNTDLTSEIQSLVNRNSDSRGERRTLATNGVTSVINDEVVGLVRTGQAFPLSQSEIRKHYFEHEQSGESKRNVEGTIRKSSSLGAALGTAAPSNIILILDSMERGRKSVLSRADVGTMTNMLSEHGVRCEVRPLPCGDALFVAQYEHDIEIMLDFLIERKTLSDFVASTHDGRVARQSFMMKQSQISRKVFVLEGELSENQDMRDKPEYARKLARLEVCDEFYVKRTKDLKDTMWFYTSMFKHLCTQFEGMSLPATLEGRTLFRDWSERMRALKNGLTLEQLFSLQLCQLQGISTSNAVAILKKGYSTPQALFRAFKNEPDPGMRENLLVDGGEGITTRTSRLLSNFFTATDYGTDVLQD